MTDNLDKFEVVLLHFVKMGTFTTALRLSAWFEVEYIFNIDKIMARLCCTTLSLWIYPGLVVASSVEIVSLRCALTLLFSCLKFAGNIDTKSLYN